MNSKLEKVYFPSLCVSIIIVEMEGNSPVSGYVYKMRYSVPEAFGIKSNDMSLLTASFSSTPSTTSPSPLLSSKSRKRKSRLVPRQCVVLYALVTKYWAYMVVNSKIRCANGTVLRCKSTACNTVVGLIKYGGLTGPSRHHTTIVRCHRSLVILAVPLLLNTARKRPFTVQYLNKMLVFDQFTAVYDDL